MNKPIFRRKLSYSIRFSFKILISDPETLILTKYTSILSSSSQSIEVASLELFDTHQFELKWELGGTFGSFLEYYYGNYFYKEGKLILSIERGYDRKWTIHEEEPEEQFYSYHKIITTKSEEDQSIRFIFPESKEVILHREI